MTTRVGMFVTAVATVALVSGALAQEALPPALTAMADTATVSMTQ